MNKSYNLTNLYIKYNHPLDHLQKTIKITKIKNIIQKYLFMI